MTLISLEPDYASRITDFLKAMPPQDSHDGDITTNAATVAALCSIPSSPLERLRICCRTLLNTTGYLILRGLKQSSDVRDILAIGHVLGTVFNDLTQQTTTIVEASPELGSTLQGNQLGPLLLHTDFAMLQQPPHVTVIQCLNADPGGENYGVNGVVVAQHIVSRYFDSPAVQRFFEIPLPFGGQTPAGEAQVATHPILSHPMVGNLTAVRFHPSRIHHGARVLGRSLTKDESRVLREFQALAYRMRLTLRLQPDDFLLLNNRAVLHDRTECSLFLSESGARSRRARILFVQELHV